VTVNSQNLRKLKKQSIYSSSDPLVRYSTCGVAIIVWVDVSIAADTVPYVTGRAISLWRARVAGILFYVSLICVASCQLALVSWVLQVQLLEFARSVKVQHPCRSLMETWRWGAALLERLEQWELAELFGKCSYYSCYTAHGGCWNPRKTSIVKVKFRLFEPCPCGGGSADVMHRENL
jgi:hypothetical protein